jgi:hypothetical protein
MMAGWTFSRDVGTIYRGLFLTENFALSGSVLVTAALSFTVPPWEHHLRVNWQVIYA